MLLMLPLLFAAAQSGAAALPCPINSPQGRAWLDTKLSPQCRLTL